MKLPDGTVEHWILQTSAPAALVRMGLKPRSDLKVGEMYRFKAAKARDGSTMGIVTELVLPDGRAFILKYGPGELAGALVANE